MTQVRWWSTWLKMGETGRPAGQSRLIPIITALLACGIFIADTITNLEIAVAVFYVAVVLMSVNFCRRRGVILISAGCVALTVLSYLLTQVGDVKAGLVNCVISLSAIGATTYLALRIQSAQLAADDARTQLAHIARITTLGELAASIAHEVNQPLGAVATNGNAALRWLAAQPPNLAEATKAVECVIDDANRASQVIARLRHLARRAPPERSQVDVNAMIEEIVTLMHHETRRNRITLRLNLDDTLPEVRGDRIQLQQVILNLLLNAIDAIAAVNDNQRDLTISTAVSDTKTVCISVVDSGIGVEPDRTERMFDPFYTTKPDGMGVGLAISRSIVEAHGGRIQVTSNAARGAALQVSLPIAREVVR